MSYSMDNPAVGIYNAFGLTRGSGSIGNVSKGVRQYKQAEVVSWQLRIKLINIDYLLVLLGQFHGLSEVLAIGQYQSCLRLVENIGVPSLGMRRGEGYV